MNKLLAFLLLIVSMSFISDKPITSDCKCKGIPLYGRVQFVDAFEDFRIQFVDVFPDIKVRFVDYNSTKCGEWRVVTSFPDFKVKIVDQFPDFKVQQVDAFPGLN
ncbi:MAG: hypothetical protein WHT29_07110 [Bacteroidales bacterium]|nr:hypothetical protein [Bacteroidales bacterium]HOK99870.1 hypothetical protein [Bacteroidales bacterium]HPO65788.1 hypothetical protein [Bacteroidales bacterium]